MTEQLRLLAPDPARAQRTLAQCREQLARRQARATQPAQPRLRVANFERAALAGLAVAYLISMASTVLRILR
jgi:hypothetical protein